MAFLLLLHEKMRLQRKVNKLTLQQLKLSSKKERITKNISKIQKLYSKKQTQLEKQAQMAQHYATSVFNNMFGVGAQQQNFSLNCYNNGTAGYLNAALQYATQWGGQNPYTGKPLTNQDGSAIFPDGNANQLLVSYMQGAIQPKVDENNKVIANEYVDRSNNNAPISAAQYEALKSASTYCNGQVQQAQLNANQMNSNYQMNVSIWLEAAKEQLEAEQDEILAPLEAEETDIELDNESCEAQLADAKARLESVKQACSEGIKDSAPTFGLG